METYKELNNRQQKEFNDFPVGFAFSNEQFKEMMEKWGFTENDASKILSIGYGGYIRKTDKDEYVKMNRRHKAEFKAAIEADKDGSGFIKEMFETELDNHEYGYTYDLDETLDALELSYEKISHTPNLNRGLQLALNKY